VKKFSIATHYDETTGKTEGLTVEGDILVHGDGGELRVVKGVTPVAVFARGGWLHAFDVEASK